MSLDGYTRVYCGIHGVYLDEAGPAIRRVREAREDPWDLYTEDQRHYVAVYTFAARRVVIVPSLGRRVGSRVEFRYDFRSLRIRHGGCGGEWTDTGCREVFEPGAAAGLRLIQECERRLFEEPGYLGGPEQWRRSGGALPTPAGLAANCALPESVCAAVLAFAGFRAYELDLRPPVAGLARVSVAAPELSPRELVVAAVAQMRKSLGRGKREDAALAALCASSHYLFGGDGDERMVAIPLAARPPDASTRRFARKATLLWSPPSSDAAVVRDAVLGTHVTVENFLDRWRASPRDAVGVEPGVRFLAHAARPFGDRPSECRRVPSAWLAPPSRPVLSWHADEDRLGTRVFRGEFAPPEPALKDPPPLPGGGCLVVTVFRASGRSVETPLRETSDANIVGGTVHSLVVDAAWDSDVVRLACLCSEVSLGTPAATCRLAKVDDINSRVRFARAEDLLPSPSNPSPVAPLGLSLSYTT